MCTRFVHDIVLVQCPKTFSFLHLVLDKEGSDCKITRVDTPVGLTSVTTDRTVTDSYIQGILIIFPHGVGKCLCGCVCVRRYNDVLT